MKKFNTLTTWPYVHACLLDRQCWREMWDYGSPMRIYWGEVWEKANAKKRGFVDIPILTCVANWRERKTWSLTPVAVAVDKEGNVITPVPTDPADAEHPPTDCDG